MGRFTPIDANRTGYYYGRSISSFFRIELFKKYTDNKRIMKKILLTAFLFAGMISCKKNDPKTEVLIENIPLSAEVWADGCAELASFENKFRISGMCCEYILLPVIMTNRQGDFKLSANLYSYDGVGGYAEIPIRVSGNLSSTDTTLTLRYVAGGRENTLTLKPGKSILKCDCACF